jgi:hypothetical protein
MAKKPRKKKVRPGQPLSDKKAEKLRKKAIASIDERLRTNKNWEDESG